MAKFTREWYDCSSCGKRWERHVGGLVQSCCVVHTPGHCCHYGETELLKSEVVAGAEDISLLLRRLAEAVALLRKIEWNGAINDGYDISIGCPCCEALRSIQPHFPDCALDKILRENP